MNQDFLNTVNFILKHEGSTIDLNTNDIGNWTGGKINSGILKGSKYGISSRTYPTIDIANLTQDQAIQIYYTDFWLKSSAQVLQFPLCLIHTDTAFNLGIGEANYCLNESNHDPSLYLLIRANYHFLEDIGTNLQSSFEGHIRRVLDLSLVIRGKWQF